VGKVTAWARWAWRDTGLGRWHIVVEVGSHGITEDGTVYTGPLYRLACGRIRPAHPAEAGYLGEGPVCPECKTLDDLRSRYVRDREPEMVGV
jgi:hypothetical protein